MKIRQRVIIRKSSFVQISSLISLSNYALTSLLTKRPATTGIISALQNYKYAF